MSISLRRLTTSPVSRTSFIVADDLPRLRFSRWRAAAISCYKGQMADVRAVVVDPASPGRLGIARVPERAAAPNEAIVRVHAFSLNRGEVKRMQSAPAGWRPGWDLAGEIERPAADGSSPREGARVVGILAEGSWAERTAVPSHALAELPDGVSTSLAAALPVAGLTALHAISRRGALTGRRVLITGATGGVGDFAVQLARASGAHVTALVRRDDQAGFVRDLGAHDVVVGDEIPGSPKQDLIVDSVGGRTLTSAFGALQRDGVCVTFGTSAADDVTFSPRTLFGIGRASLYGLTLFNELPIEPASIGLRRLLDLVSAGSLSPRISVERPWAHVGAVADDLLHRRFSGKAVLTI
jgi:NADPH:quinone reductase-like Zn-dependent oxidoreductase